MKINKTILLKKFLRFYRKSAGLTITRASFLSGVPYRTWHGWESITVSSSRRVPRIAFTWLNLYIKSKK